MIAVKISVVQQGKVVDFAHDLIDDSRPVLETVVDHFEAQIGTVLEIHDLNGQRLYKSAVEPHEAGVL